MYRDCCIQDFYGSVPGCPTHNYYVHVHVHACMFVTGVTRGRGAEARRTTVAVGMRIRNEVGGAVDWVVDGHGMRVGHSGRELEGSEIN